MKRLFAEMDPSERLQALRDNASKIERQEYYKQLPEEERRELLEEQLDHSHKSLVLEEELADIRKDMRKRIKDHRKAAAAIVYDLRRGSKLVEEEVFLMPDFGSNMMEIYSGDGVLISSRPLFPEEKQSNIFNLKQAGNE